MSLFSHNDHNGHNLTGFWRLSRQFWFGGGVRVTGLIVTLIAVVLLQLLVQFYLNLWNRHFFDALERRNAAVLWAQLMHHDMRAEAKAVRWGLMTPLRWRLRYARWLRPEPPPS